MTPLSVMTSLRRSSRCTFPCMTHKHRPVSHQLHANPVSMLAFDAMQISAESSKQLSASFTPWTRCRVRANPSAGAKASPAIHPRCLKTQQIKTGMQMPPRLKGVRFPYTHTHTPGVNMCWFFCITLQIFCLWSDWINVIMTERRLQLSRKAPLINGISMQTHRRRSLWLIQWRETNTHTHMCTQAKQCVLYWEEKKETLYLPSSFDPSPRLFLSAPLTHPSSLRLLGWMCLCIR